MSSSSPPATSPDEPMPPTAAGLVPKPVASEIPRSDPYSIPITSTSDIYRNDLYSDSIAAAVTTPQDIPHSVPQLPEPDQQEKETEYEHEALVLRPQLRDFSPINPIDPFNQLPVRLSSQMHQILQSTLRIYPYSGNNYKLAHLPNHIRQNIRAFPIADVVQRAVTAPHHLYSLLACISIRMQGAFREHIPAESPKNFQVQAFHHLNEVFLASTLKGGVDANTILDLLFLVVGETGTGDYEAARKHLEIVSQFYHILDLQKNLDFWVSESCAHVDNQLALASGSKPVFPQTFDPGPLLPERKAALRRELRWLFENLSSPSQSYYYPSPTALAVQAPPRGLTDAIADFAANLDMRMGLAFEQALHLGLLSPLLQPIVTDIVDCVAIAKVVWLSPHAVCFDAEWLCRKARATLRRLLIIAPENNIGPLDVLGKCMEVVRCTLLIAMSHACTLIGFQTAKLNVTKLQYALAFALKFWAPAMGLTAEMQPLESGAHGAGVPLDIIRLNVGHILYNAMVGLFSADWPGYESTQEFFMRIVVNCCSLLGIRNYRQLREHMVHYLYSPVLMEKSLVAVAEQLKRGPVPTRVVDVS